MNAPRFWAVIAALTITPALTLADSVGSTHDVVKWCKDGARWFDGDCSVRARGAEIVVRGEAAGCLNDREMIHLDTGTHHQKNGDHQWFFQFANSCNKRVHVRVQFLRDSGGHMGKYDSYADDLSPRNGWARIGFLGFNRSPELSYRITATFSKW